MFMPSERIWTEMKYEPIGFWPVPINRGDEYALLVKAPTHVIKAAYRSCPVTLSISAAVTPVGTVIATALLIEDDPASPLIVTGVHRHGDEQLALEQVLRAGQALFVFFDELSRPVLRAECTLDSGARTSASSLVDSSGARYVGPWISTLADVLDELQATTDPAIASPARYAPNIAKVPLTLTNFHVAHIAAIGENEVREFQLDDFDEGYVQEHATWHLLEDLFGANIFHSPQAVQESKPRELTDILSFCDAGVCLLESKAVAVLSTDPHRTTQRRARNIQKQIDKGLSQLPGAMRSLANGCPLTSKQGRPIRLPEGMGCVRHGIIMVSELFPSVDWESVGTRLLSESRVTGMMLHVLDLQELRLLVGVSNRDPTKFMVHLIHRFEKMSQCGSAYIRTRLGGPPLP